MFYDFCVRWGLGLLVWVGFAFGGVFFGGGVVYANEQSDVIEQIRAQAQVLQQRIAEAQAGAGATDSEDGAGGVNAAEAVRAQIAEVQRKIAEVQTGAGAGAGVGGVDNTAALAALRAHIVEVQRRIAEQQAAASAVVVPVVPGGSVNSLDAVRAQIAEVQERIAEQRGAVKEADAEAEEEEQVAEERDLESGVRAQIAELQRRIAERQREQEEQEEVVAEERQPAVGAVPAATTMSGVLAQIVEIRRQILERQRAVLDSGGETVSEVTVKPVKPVEVAEETAAPGDDVLDAVRAQIAEIQRKIAEKRGEQERVAGQQTTEDSSGSGGVSDAVRAQIAEIQRKIAEKQREQEQVVTERTRAGTVSGGSAGSSQTVQSSQPAEPVAADTVQEVEQQGEYIDEVKDRMTEIIIRLTDPGLSEAERNRLTGQLNALSRQLSASTNE